jgi:hypothetical protein
LAPAHFFCAVMWLVDDQREANGLDVGDGEIVGCRGGGSDSDGVGLGLGSRCGGGSYGDGGGAAAAGDGEDREGQKGKGGERWRGTRTECGVAAKRDEEGCERDRARQRTREEKFIQIAGQEGAALSRISKNCREGSRDGRNCDGERGG